MEVCYFNSELAKEIGVIESTFLQLLFCIIRDNRAKCVVEDDNYWFPCAIKEWETYIDLWSYRQTDRIVKNCLSKNVLLLRHYDDDERRRRGWYAINKSIIPFLEQAEQFL